MFCSTAANRAYGLIIYLLRRVARNSQSWRGLFWKLETTVNELDPNFHQSWIRLRRFFCQNQMISRKKKKVFTQIQSVFLTNLRWGPGKKTPLSGPNNSKSFTTSARQSYWFGGKIGLKSTKKWYFAYFSGQWGARAPPPPPPPPPGYATVPTRDTYTGARENKRAKYIDKNKFFISKKWSPKGRSFKIVW